MSILYLHGFRTNKQILELQTAKLRNALPEYEHHLINAFYKAEKDPEDPTIKKYFAPPFYEHCQFNYLENSKITYSGVEKTIEYLSDIIKKKNITAIVGFSQGGYIGSLLTNFFDFDFFISICSMPYREDNFSVNYNTRSLHIIGEKDKWFKAGEFFSNQFVDSKLIIHKGGHHFPRERKIYQQIVDWVEDSLI